MISWTAEDWRNVLFTDESKFELFGGGRRRHYVRRMQGERMNSQCVVSTVKHGGGSIMVWGCFGNGQTGDLKKVEGILKKEGYHQILVKHAIPSGKRLMGGKFAFQQDNDPKHTSILCKKIPRKQSKRQHFDLYGPSSTVSRCQPHRIIVGRTGQKGENSTTNESEPIVGVSSNCLE